MDIILLRILIFIICCLIGLGMVSLVGSRSKVYKKEVTPQVTTQVTTQVIEECSEGICPEPKNWEGGKK